MDERAARTRTILKRRYPTTADLRAAGRARLPHFAFEYADGGAGGEDNNIRRNWSSFDRVELVPRIGVVTAPPPSETSLFGRSYAAPVGIAPMGGPSLVFPGADGAMARAAQRLRLPYVLGLVASMTIERAAELAPDVLWLQLYRCPRNDHALGVDLLARAAAVGVHVMVLTVDSPTRTVRPREVKGGIPPPPFRMTPRLILDALRAPRWLYAMSQHGIPRFANFTKYLPHAGIHEMADFAARELGGAFTWDEIARYRDKWKKPLVLKGVLHPDDAERAVALGVDGVIVSNHGGRQVEALPASIDVLPAIVERVRGRLSVLLDSGIRSGTDVARAIALGADAAFSGKAILWSLGALGLHGPDVVLELLAEEIRSTLGQLGCHAVSDLRLVASRHPTAYRSEDFVV